MSIVKNIKNNRNSNAGLADIKLEHLPRIEDVAFIKDEIAFVLNDGRIIYIPLSWSKKIQQAKHKERQNFKNTGIHVFWEDLDEIIGVKNILFGKELFL